MSKLIESVYTSSTASIQSDRQNLNGLEIYYILYGYEVDSLHHLFPIVVVAGDGKGREEVQNTVRELLTGNDEIYIRAPGEYDPPVATNTDTVCQVEFIHITPDDDPDLISGFNPQNARSIAISLEKQLSQPDTNLYYSVLEAGDISRALFILNYTDSPEVQLPFPTERPEGPNYGQHLDTSFPCYILTKKFSQRSIKKPVTMKWIYPRI